jgi:hypothetical protein
LESVSTTRTCLVAAWRIGVTTGFTTRTVKSFDVLSTRESNSGNSPPTITTNKRQTTAVRRIVPIFVRLRVILRLPHGSPGEAKLSLGILSPNVNGSSVIRPNPSRGIVMQTDHHILEFPNALKTQPLRRSPILVDRNAPDISEVLLNVGVTESRDGCDRRYSLPSGHGSYTVKSYRIAYSFRRGFPLRSNERRTAAPLTARTHSRLLP